MEVGCYPYATCTYITANRAMMMFSYRKLSDVLPGMWFGLQPWVHE